MEKILISSCLLGCRVRYDGKSVLVNSQVLNAWSQERRLVSICPEVSGGLSVPRPACEIVDGDGQKVLSKQAKVLSKDKKDYSYEYIQGAKFALELAQKHSIKIAILKKNSPSCGNEQIYDGTFSGTKIPGSGVAASLLLQNNIKVFNEDQILQAQSFLEALEPKNKTDAR